MSPLVVWLVFAVLTALLCLIKPSFGRVFIGIFFCVMAIGVNLSIAIIDPQLFVDLVDGAHPEIYRKALVALVELNPRLVGIAAATFEFGVGVLILGHGRAVRIGLVLGIVFLFGITPLRTEELPNVIIAAGLAHLVIALDRPEHWRVASMCERQRLKRCER